MFRSMYFNTGNIKEQLVTMIEILICLKNNLNEKFQYLLAGPKMVSSLIYECHTDKLTSYLSKINAKLDLWACQIHKIIRILSYNYFQISQITMQVFRIIGPANGLCFCFQIFSIFFYSQ